jgi:hypothetical protein
MYAAPMDADEVAQHEAEEKAAALHSVGWKMGAGATIWARAARDQLALHEQARDRYTANTANLESWERLHASALMLVVAIDQVLAFEQRVRRLTDDADLAQARASFDAEFPSAERLRDLVSHLDAYAVGEGWRQTGKRMPPLKESFVSLLISWTDSGITDLDLGNDQLNLQAATKAATELAEVVEAVRFKHLERAGQEANAAFGRRFPK